MAGNYFAGATASCEPTAKGSSRENMDKMRGGASEADYRALETVAGASSVTSVLLREEQGVSDGASRGAR